MNILITGANRGIGLTLTEIYQKFGHNVFATCRKPSLELEKTGANVITEIDVTNLSSLKRLSEKLGQQKIDILINNAGVLFKDDFNHLNYEEITKQFEVNTLGPLKVAEALVKNLSANAKMGILTSRMGSIEDNTSGGMYGYRLSKAAANAVGKSLSLDLKDQNIAVAILHPGFVQTEMTGGMGNIDSHTAAHGLIEVMDKVTLENTGQFWHSNGSKLPW